MAKLRQLLPGLLLLICAIATTGKTKVACIGNSITYGYLLDDPSTKSYPSQLQKLLGEEYVVGNFGKSGATLLRKGHRPYFDQPEFRSAMDFCPDIAVIHLGINDTDPRNWPNYGDEFAGDYLALVDSLRAVNPSVRVLIARLTPIGASHFRFKSGTRLWLREIQDIIPRIAKAAGAELIDFDEPLRNRQDLMPDAIHPNAEGAGLLAKEVFQAITGNHEGLQLPHIYQTGMVMQRDRYLPIEGIADAGRTVKVTLGGTSRTCTADNRGRWCVMMPPIIGGESYEMTVTDGDSTIRLTDILGGEVWIASGQSNMELHLSSDLDFETAMQSADDPRLRFYDMKPVVRTDDIQWSDSAINEINRLNHFRATRWEESTQKNAAEFSAVAYYFGRHLRDSLKVPIGIISNPTGGATTESWIDITTLEDNIPEILLNWRTNDYVQKWAQQRADKNTGPEHPKARHPYEPSYLFSAGIEPLGHYPIKGLIWYQGESNAHNTDIHARLFPLLAESWRRYFNDPEMPIIYAQLSSINRPSWPEFRNSQRELEKQIKNVYMAVTSDVGDSIDVHPRSKGPVGERMARQALHHVYGMTAVTPSGPQPISARADGEGAIIIKFDNANGLTTAKGDAPKTFEIAETDGLYKPATAEIINGNEIKVYNMELKNPKYVRYAWQPFTRANLVNGDDLPASTFKIEAENITDEIEPGIECGISAPFAAMSGGRLIFAGGCNFPKDPMAAGAQKKFYSGIYAADTSTMAWERIGTLPQATAYGATANTPEGVVMIGGTPDGKPTADVNILRFENGELKGIDALPSLPCTLDNMASAAIANKVYVAGGNADGKPSAELYMLDLSDPAQGWRELRRMPGNPRVQPVMAAAKSRNGETCLYLWGGFAGRYDGHEPTLELGGLCYTPSKNRWSALPAPTDENGEAISTGGGAACTLSDGRIAVTGGVNKDIFLAALRNQPADYLSHPIEWYRFNANILIFDPQKEKWSIESAMPETARAGAAMIAGPHSDFYLIGGELKPRIRTAETINVTVTTE